METIKDKVWLYAKLREQKKEIEAQIAKLSAEIKNYATTHGSKDSNGSYYMEDERYVYGSSAKKSISLNEERALDFVKEHGFNQCIEMVEKLNLDKLDSLVSDGSITPEELAKLTDTKISYSVMVKERDDTLEMEVAEIIEPKKKPKARVRLSSKRRK